MKISLNWLSDYIDLEAERKNPKELARLLTEAGLEVESIQDLSLPFKNVVVGAVLKKSLHPNSDRLSLCQVSVGDGVVQQIVCGAQNHKEGDRVAVALPGAELANGVKISSSQIRGVESVGMLCSESELGLSSEASEGILILDSSAKIGTPLARFLGMDDFVFELKVTPNRADCLSHLGLAREISTLLVRPLRSTAAFAAMADMEVSASDSEQNGPITVEVTERARAFCPRYCGQAIKNIKIAPSPDWLKVRLRAVGLKSINNVVDVTNFVMFEMGQPLHAFDASLLEGKKIRVDLAQSKEKFTSLDGTNIELGNEDLTIRDRERVVALAGVVGGLNSGVNADTKEIFVESALFSAGSTRKTSRKHGVQTESGYRFSRGVNGCQTESALKRAVGLILQVAGGEIDGDEIDLVFESHRPAEIDLKYSIVNERLGYPVSAEAIETRLKSLGCVVVNKTDRGIKVQGPKHRMDLTIDMDLVEEIARLEGYSLIPETLPHSDFIPTPSHSDSLDAERLRRAMVELGAHEARNFPFVSELRQTQFLGQLERLRANGLETEDQAIKLLNPIAEDLNVMRKSLTFSLFQNVELNQRRGRMRGALFEVGVSHHRKLANSRNEENNGTEFGEQHRLAFAVWGERLTLSEKMRGANAAQEPVEVAVRWILQLAQRIGLKIQTVAGRPEHCPSFLHPGQWVGLSNGEHLVGFVGTIHPELSSKEKLRAPVAFCEVAWKRALSAKRGEKAPLVRRYLPISAYPSVERDFAFLVRVAVPNGDVVELIKSALEPDLTDRGIRLGSVELFDVFSSDKLPTDQEGRAQKSIAVRVRVDSMRMTLNDELIKAVSDQVISKTEQAFGARLRG